MKVNLAIKVHQGVQSFRKTEYKTKYYCAKYAKINKVLVCICYSAGTYFEDNI